MSKKLRLCLTIILSGVIAMVAATCIGIEKGVSMQEILRMATAAGTAAVTTSGTNLFYKDKYDEIYSKVYSERIY